jgi:hypothetical protein
MNPYTAKHAPPKSKQFGHALDWILYQLWYADPKHGPVYILKIDISDPSIKSGLKHTMSWQRQWYSPRCQESCPWLQCLCFYIGIGRVTIHLFVATEMIADLTNSHLQWCYAPPH